MEPTDMECIIGQLELMNRHLNWQCRVMESFVKAYCNKHNLETPTVSNIIPDGRL